MRGDSDRDVSVLRLRAPVSPSDNCLSFEFRFLSEEFPEFVNAGFNDAFIAELRASNWTTDSGDDHGAEQLRLRRRQQPDHDRLRG